MPKRPDMIQGTLDLLILKLLSLEPMHGWGLSESIQQLSDDVLRVNQGSLYPALHRLTASGWIESSWKTTESSRRARFYRLTPSGRRELARIEGHWRRLAGAVEQILQAT